MRKWVNGSNRLMAQSVNGIYGRSGLSAPGRTFILILFFTYSPINPFTHFRIPHPPVKC